MRDDARRDTRWEPRGSLDPLARMLTYDELYWPDGTLRSRDDGHALEQAEYMGEHADGSGNDSAASSASRTEWSRSHPEPRDTSAKVTSREPDWVRDEPGAVGPNGKPDASAVLNSLAFHDLREVLRSIVDAPPARYLARPLIPSDAYGVLAAAWKAGKTWIALDLAVAVSGAKAWLGAYAIELPGPVLLLLGEGGPRKMVRRLKAIADHYDLELAELPLRLCFRAPHLASFDHLEQVGREIDATRPVLVVLDPLYLAARGAQGSQLYDVGAHLEAIQSLCQRHRAALLIVHHHNRGEGRGAVRMSGAGPAEWGRFLISATVVSSRTDPGDA